MALGLLNQEITPVRGNAALLPNQPILQGCVVSASETSTLLPGDVVALATGGNANRVVIKRAAVTDKPIGVVVGNPIKTGFVKGDAVSVFPAGSYVYMKAGAANIARGANLQFNATGDVVATSTSGNGIIGTAYTAGVASGDIIIVHLEPNKTPSEVDLSGYLTTSVAEATYQPILTAGDFIDITSNTITTTYSAGTGIAISAEGAISVAEG